MRASTALPDSILSRHFDKVRAKWPDAILAAYSGGFAALSVPAAKLFNPEDWNRPTTTLLALLPPGYPQSEPNEFYYESNLTLAHGGIPASTFEFYELFGGPSQRRIPGFTRLMMRMRPRTWNPNDCDMVTVVNFMRVALNAAEPAPTHKGGE